MQESKEFRPFGYVTQAQVENRKRELAFESQHGKTQDLKVVALRSMDGPGQKMVRVISLKKRTI